MEMANFNVSACPLPRRHHWWISNVPYPACRCTAAAEKALTEWQKDDATAASTIAYTLSSLLWGSYWLLPVLKTSEISYVHRLSIVVCSSLTCSLSHSSRHNRTARKTLTRMSLGFKNCLSTLTANGRNTVQIRCLNVSSLDKFCHLLVRNMTVSTMFGIPFLRANKWSIYALRRSAQLSCELTDWHCAFVAHENDKKKSNSMEVNSSKSMKRGADSIKQNFPCNKCKNLVTWQLRSALKSNNVQGTEVVNQLQRGMLMRS